MELDDVAEKARRNLMMVATGILAVWALGIPLDGKLVGAVDLSAVQPWRAWIVALIVLIYFSARYHYAPEQAERWGKWKTRRQRELNRLVELSFKAALQRPMPESTEDVVFKLPNKPIEPGWVLLQKSPPMWKHRECTFDFKWAKQANGVMKVGVTGHVAFEDQSTRLKGQASLSRAHYRKLRKQAWSFAYTPSWDLLELSVPWIVTIPAGIVCVWRILSSLYYEFPFTLRLLLT